jgi:hypothetical protein
MLQIGGLNANNYYYIRYAGMCRLPVTPIDRLNEDLKERKNGFISYFFKKIDSLSGQLKPVTNVYVMQGDSVNIPIYSLTVKDSADIQEQVLIHLFGLEQLLNSQAGGYNAK